MLLSTAMITLVLKVSNPSTVKEYRPIACCSVLYKIISKVLATRLQKVISHVTSEAQIGFILRRKIIDNIILAHELVKGYTRKNISDKVMIKIDLQKAYDSIEWVFLEKVMEELGFPDRYIYWIMQCVKIVSSTIMVNGEIVVPFSVAKG